MNSDFDSAENDAVLTVILDDGNKPLDAMLTPILDNGNKPLDTVLTPILDNGNKPRFEYQKHTPTLTGNPHLAVENNPYLAHANIAVKKRKVLELVKEPYYSHSHSHGYSHSHSRGQSRIEHLEAREHVEHLEIREHVEHNQQSEQNGRLAKLKPESAHGNYAHYYGYRLKSQPDPRLSLLKPEWFHQKTVLDVGCNSGLVSIQIGFHLEPVSIVGVDLDPALIKKAKALLTNTASLADEANTRLDHFPVSCLSLGKRPTLKLPTFPHNIEFRCSDWVNEPKSTDKFDVILALSITKWIHLNGGDGGLKYFFKKTFESLNQGGRLILEPQEWAGYAKRSSLSETMKSNYNAIKLKPAGFVQYLLSPQVGFTSCTELTTLSTQKGFDRNVYVLVK